MTTISIPATIDWFFIFALVFMAACIIIFFTLLHKDLKRSRNYKKILEQQQKEKEETQNENDNENTGIIEDSEKETNNTEKIDNTVTTQESISQGSTK